MAKINVGAATESEMKEKKARVEDAMHATRAANQEGILPGGGVALLRASAGLKPQGPVSHDEEIGYNIVVRACKSPIQQIAENAGEDGAVVMNKVLENKDQQLRLRRPPGPLLRHGQGRHHRPDQGGALGACRTRPAWRRCCLTSDALVAEMPKEEKKPAGGGGMTICIERSGAGGLSPLSPVLGGEARRWQRPCPFPEVAVSRDAERLLRSRLLFYSVPSSTSRTFRANAARENGFCRKLDSSSRMPCRTMMSSV